MDKIDFKEDRGETFYYLLLTAITQLSKKKGDEFTKNWLSKDEHEMCLLVDDKYKFSIKKIIEEWEKQVDDMIEKQALILIENKTADLLNVVSDTMEDIEYKLKELVKAVNNTTEGKL